MEIKCSYTELRDVVSLVKHPKNPNTHSDQQINLLARIMKYQGVRHPIVISKKTGFVVAGHGRLAAAVKNGWEKFPVDVQEFENEAQELAFLISDNTLSEMSETDKELVKMIALELPTEFSLDMLAVPDLKLEENNIELVADVQKPTYAKTAICPECKVTFTLVD